MSEDNSTQIKTLLVKKKSTPIKTAMTDRLSKQRWQIVTGKADLSDFHFEILNIYTQYTVAHKFSLVSNLCGMIETIWVNSEERKNSWQKNEAFVISSTLWSLRYHTQINWTYL